MLDMYFESAKDALELYVTYARLAGFDIRKTIIRNNGRAQEVECKASGEYKRGLGPDRTRAKTTKKRKCKALVCITRSAKLPERSK
jgi:hypothetical protein